jgi:hypothetical protein
MKALTTSLWRMAGALRLRAGTRGKSFQRALLRALSVMVA